MHRLAVLLLCCAVAPAAFAQPEIPAIHSNLSVGADSQLVFTAGTQVYVEPETVPRYTLKQMEGDPIGTEIGIDFFFGDDFEGVLYAGLMPYADYRHPLPVYRQAVPIVEGQASVDLDGFRGRYDMIGWEASGHGVLGYRVVDAGGLIVYDGRVGFRGTGPFTVDATLVEGPFVNLPTPEGATISFRTNMPVAAHVEVDGRRFSSSEGLNHEITLTGLAPDSTYAYAVHYGENSQRYSLRTAPAPGSRTAFTFAYASDSRAAVGGGERNLYGTNYYMVKRIMALASARGVAFTQFTGDLIDGYLTNRGEMDLQYVNWKRAVEPFAHYMPVVAGMGNHELFMRGFRPAEDTGPVGFLPIGLDRFPYATESSERVFADHFVNPRNGPASEDGAVYDPDPDRTDFPSYEENVFAYAWDNVGMITLNSDYWYARNPNAIRFTGGNPHGYVMDQQLAWLEETVAAFEADPAIDHVFVTIHTPFFPNGGHVHDDMWYNGQNDFRPYVAGRPVAHGIIERRDQLLDVLVNRSEKVVAILTGDEHNYNRLEIAPETERYPEVWFLPRLELRRTIHQVNNGAAGAPYYAQQQTPWTPWVSGFTTQNAVVFFHVDGPSLRMEVLNPDTLEPVDELVLR